jgi:TatD DNase family protein
MMLETDAPYLAPQIYRGKRNEPCCLVNLVDFLSGQRAIAPDVLESETSKNAIALFGLNVANE